MRTFYTVMLLAAVVMLACGCKGLWRAKGGKAAGSAGQATAGDGQIEASCASLEQHGFAILDFRAIRDEHNMVSVIGEIENVGPVASGVELQATLRDAHGRVVAVGHFCPASYQNIVPGEKWPFSHSFGRQNEAARAELRIVGAFRTMDIPGVASTLP